MVIKDKTSPVFSTVRVVALLVDYRGLQVQNISVEKNIKSPLVKFLSFNSNNKDRKLYLIVVSATKILNEMKKAPILIYNKYT